MPTMGVLLILHFPIKLPSRTLPSRVMPTYIRSIRRKLYNYDVTVSVMKFNMPFTYIHVLNMFVLNHKKILMMGVDIATYAYLCEDVVRGCYSKFMYSAEFIFLRNFARLSRFLI